MTRDEYIVLEFTEGRPIPELARMNGLSKRRVQQILKEQEVRVNRVARSKTEVQPVSALHVKIGLTVYNFRYDNEFSIGEAAERIGWSKQKLRQVERGLRDITLLDIQDIAGYLRCKPEDFWGRYVYVV